MTNKVVVWSQGSCQTTASTRPAHMSMATSDWCFSSYRGRPVHVSDSDSDIDPDPGAKNDTTDARLIREMDLSARHETVEYRSNPWSIARINAASRPSIPKPTLATTPAPARPPPKSRPKPIVEAFRKQARRGTRGDQPAVRDGSPLGPDSVHRPGAIKSCAAIRAANKPPQGGEPTQDTVHTKLLDSPHQPQAGPAVYPTEPLAKKKPAHISTFSDRAVQYNPPLKLNRDASRRWSSPGLPSPPHASRAAKGRPTLIHSSPGPRLHAPAPGKVHSSPGTRRPTATSYDYPSASTQPLQGTAPSWLVDVLHEGTRVSPPPPPPVVHKTGQAATDPPHIRTPEPKRKRLTSPEPTAPRKAPRGCPTAYAFGQDDDPDAEWSTLARTRRKATSAVRVAKLNGVKQSGGFRLPLLGLATPMRAPEATRRVITYLPPPMASKSLNLVNDDRGPRAYQAQADKVITAATHAQTDADAHDDEIPVMDSDVTLVNEDEEDVARVDVDDMCVRYPTTRACMKA
ncbi:hypothetical protein HD554DRAFT_1758864 [Boletus coccyginus]|nr:hypothetical protein HD554DRAFT_1758864 [Boletus coccyginus]